MVTVVRSMLIDKGKVVPIEVQVETTSYGIPFTKIVGSADKIVQESKERARAAIRSCGYKLKARKTTILLAPTELHKHTASLDLPVAIGLLASQGLIPPPSQTMMFVGELGLDGRIQPMQNSNAFSPYAYIAGCTKLILPYSKTHLQSNNLDILMASHLREVISYLQGTGRLSSPQHTIGANQKLKKHSLQKPLHHLSPSTQRYLAAAALTKSSVQIQSSNTVVCKKAATFLHESLPSLSLEQQVDIASLFALHNEPYTSLLPPLRTIDCALFQHKFVEKEMILAHHGLLLLMNLDQCTPRDMQHISHIYQTLEKPLQPLLLVHTAPCVCGTEESSQCVCTAAEKKKFYKKSAAFMRRNTILHIHIEELQEQKTASLNIPEKINQTLKPNQKALQLLNATAAKRSYSALWKERVLSIAQALATLDNSTEIEPTAIAEAASITTP